MKWLTLPIMILFLMLMVFATTGLPQRGDPQAPASIHVSPYYIEKTIKETGTPNIVTSVLADYRGYDTLGETVVIFTASLACILVLWKGRE